ncbi:MAG: hypothetical protein CFE29_03525 [Bradyrhizobiaceae bacterium PARB1]|jgi:hypothetical protein|nr:MAG: hypothetical protein CFE29_03525 [Bradyrhizobiaceae bacterium PARB1]
MPSEILRADSYVIAWTGSVADIRMAASVKAEYDQAIARKDINSIQRRVHLQRSFKEFCENDEFWRRLSDEKLKREGKFPDGNGTDATIWVFKAWQWRLYGAIMKVNARRCFVAVSVDPNKKRDRADQKLLKATAKSLGKLAEYKAE